MSSKRSRAAYEADLQAQQSPFVLFGTPLPPLDPEVRDDGSYVPVWKQEVRDERGRKRLHGAFTGGWSAGYFNTVGSKEGWTPSTFVSSRTNRRKDDPKTAQQRPEDFMDEEDLADAEEARKIQTADSFAGLGSTEQESLRNGGLAGLFRVEGETMGTKLLKKMGWKGGQGIGPKIRRKAILGVGNNAGAADAGDTYLFAPENVLMISFERKMDRKGLGYDGDSSLTPFGTTQGRGTARSEDDEDEDGVGGFGQPRTSIAMKAKSKDKKANGGIGIGILNDTGSDDEDPYEIGPRISYNRVIGGEKRKKKTTSANTSINPTLRSKPVFLSKKTGLAKVGLGLRKCHDGRLPLDGFVFGQAADSLTSTINAEGRYPPPKVPLGWKSAKQPKAASEQTSYVSTADAAKASNLDPKSRALLLGETQLPGKSVFDFISPAARERLAAVSGRADLPEAKGEVPEGYDLTEEERLKELLNSALRLDKETAVGAISRGAGGNAPYADDTQKRSRYRAYLEYEAGFTKALPPKPPEMSIDDWLREFHEFYRCAGIFKPISGLMASRFTTSSAASKPSGGPSGQTDDKELVSKPAPKPKDPAEEAAKLGMYGPMTRSVAEFYPTRLLCKRFGVKPPANVQSEKDTETGGGPKSAAASSGPFGGFQSSPGSSGLELLSLDFRPPGSGVQEANAADPSPGEQEAVGTGPKKEEAPVDITWNEALEGKRAGEEVFKAIFGDSSDEE